MWALITLLTLLALMVLLRLVGTEIPGIDPEARASIAAAGFITLAAFASGELARRLKLPALLGYLAAGILLGPQLAALLGRPEYALFDERVISELALVNMLTVGVIGTMGGGELKLADLRLNAKEIVAVVAVVFLTVLPLTATLVLGISQVLPEVAGFLAELRFDARLAAALLFGVLACGMSPAATLALMQDVRARGPFTSLVLGVVVAADLVLVATFLVVLALARLMVSPEGIDAARVLASLPVIAAEFGWALLIGVATGSILILYLRFVRREMLFFSVGVIFAASYVAQVVHAETLLAFLTAGFVVQNFSRHGHELIHAFEQIGLPVFVIYFTTQAAGLDLAALGAYVPLTLALVGTRVTLFYFGVRAVARAVGRTETSRHFLWMCFFSQGGVDLVLGAIVASAIPTWGPEFQTVIMATVIIYILAGPPLLKLALERAGETEEVRQRPQETSELSHLGTASGLSAPAYPEDPFPEPKVEDERLAGRLGELRAGLMALHRRVFADPVEATAARFSALLEELAAPMSTAEEALAAAVEKDGAEAKEALEKAHRAYRETLFARVPGWAELPAVAFERKDVEALFGQLSEMESFSSEYRVEREAQLFLAQPADGRALRGVKVLRRARRRVLGPGQRIVPLGRLWRFYVALSAPRQLSRILGTGVPSFWSELAVHLREEERLFEQLREALAGGAASPRELLAQHRRARSERAARLEARVAHLGTALLGGLAGSLGSSWRSFLEAVAHAGSMELPASAYRPSAQFDRVRRAREGWLARLEREAVLARAHRDRAVLERALDGFEIRFGAQQNRTIHSLARLLGGRGLTALRDLAGRCAEPGARAGQGAGAEWRQLFDTVYRPALARARRALDDTLSRAEIGAGVRSPLQDLEHAVDELPEELTGLVDVVEAGLEGRPPDAVQIPLREWLRTELITDVALVMVEANDRAAHALRRALHELGKVEQVIEYHLLAVHPEAADAEGQRLAREMALGGLERAGRLARQIVDDLAEASEKLERWWREETQRLLVDALGPLREARLVEVQRRKARWQKGPIGVEPPGAVGRSVSRVFIRARRGYRRALPSMVEAWEDLTAWVEGGDAARARAARGHGRLLRAQGDLRLPTVYRRLFAPSPLEIGELYLERPAVEAACRSVIEAWRVGRPRSLLIHGDPGVGRRSLVLHLLERGEPGVQVRMLRLEEDGDPEGALVRALGQLGEGPDLDGLAAVQRRLGSLEERQVVVIENGDQIFRRRPQDLEVVDRLLSLVSGTSANTLWVLLLGTPALRLLETTHQITSYFTDVVEVPPLAREELEELLMSRHRVSGFDLVFQPPRLRAWRRLTQPLRAAESKKNPARAFFENLMRLSEGNLRQALLLWVRAARLDPKESTRILMSPLPEALPDLVEACSPFGRLVLACFVRHGVLGEPQLREMLRAPRADILAELERLQQLGVLEALTGAPGMLELESFLEHPVTAALRRRNVL